MSVDVAQLETHRTILTGHCYRMLGSAVDADDAVQETMLRAWKSIERFDGRSSLKTWLYRIATNVCLDTLGDRGRRVRVIDDGPVRTIDRLDDELATQPRTHWLEPVPESRVIPEHLDPGERAVLRQSIRLAFVAALQHLPPKQRAALLLTEVLGWSVAEVADSLDTSVASINSALQRARTTLAVQQLRDDDALTGDQQRLVDEYFEAFERYDIDALAAMLTKEATLSMPPFTMWLQGVDSISAWLLGPGRPCRGSKLVRVDASGQPAFAQYRDGGRTPWALLVLELEGARIRSMTSFLDVQSLFPLFGLPPTWS